QSVYAIGDHFVIDPILAPAINPLRRELGLPPVSRFLHEWWHAPRLTIGLFPEWYAPPQADWPSQTELTDFPLYDEAELEPPSDDLQQFLAAGDQPVAFTAGSAMALGSDFYRAAVEACVRGGLRGVLLTRYTEQLPKDLPDTVKHVPYAPFSQLLPRCATLVHHGGIGTTAQGLAAGVPQLIMPMSHDQPDNADRIQRLGVGT